MNAQERTRRRDQITTAQKLLDSEVAEHVIARFMSKQMTIEMMREVKAFATERLRFELVQKGWDTDTARAFFVRVARPSETMLMLRVDRSDRR